MALRVVVGGGGAVMMVMYVLNTPKSITEVSNGVGPLCSIQSKREDNFVKISRRNKKKKKAHSESSMGTSGRTSLRCTVCLSVVVVLHCNSVRGGGLLELFVPLLLLCLWRRVGMMISVRITGRRRHGRRRRGGAKDFAGKPPNPRS